VSLDHVHVKRTIIGQNWFSECFATNPRMRSGKPTHKHKHTHTQEAPVDYAR